jgi:hypothetical protein
MEVAAAPMMMKTTEKPSTKNTDRQPARYADSLLVLVDNSWTDTPEIYDMYAGTSGNTHGDMKDRNPPTKAMANDMVIGSSPENGLLLT